MDNFDLFRKKPKWKQTLFEELKIEDEPLKTKSLDRTLCPECGSEVRFEGSCFFCPNCGYSPC